MSTCYQPLVNCNENIWQKIKHDHEFRTDGLLILLQSVLTTTPYGIIRIITEFEGNIAIKIQAYEAIKSVYDRINPFQFMFFKGLSYDRIKYYFSKLDLDINDPNLEPVVHILELCNSFQLIPTNNFLNHLYEPELTLLRLQDWSNLSDHKHQAADCEKHKFLFQHFKILSNLEQINDINNYVLIGEYDGHLNSVIHSFVLLHKITAKIYNFHYCTVASGEETFGIIAESFTDWINDCGSNYWDNLRECGYAPHMESYIEHNDKYENGNKYYKNCDLWAKATNYIMQQDAVTIEDEFDYDDEEDEYEDDVDMIQDEFDGLNDFNMLQREL
eukprot:461775_1